MNTRPRHGQHYAPSALSASSTASNATLDAAATQIASQLSGPFNGTEPVDSMHSGADRSLHAAMSNTAAADQETELDDNR